MKDNSDSLQNAGMSLRFRCRRVPATEKKNALFTLSVAFRHHVEKKRSVVGSKQRLARDVLGPRLRINAVRAKNDRRNLEVRRPSFGRTPKRRSGRPPLRRDFTCTFRAGPNHGGRR